MWVGRSGEEGRLDQPHTGKPLHPSMGYRGVSLLYLISPGVDISAIFLSRINITLEVIAHLQHTSNEKEVLGQLDIVYLASL